MAKNDFPFIRMVIRMQQGTKNDVEIWDRNVGSKLLIFVVGSGSKLELKYNLFRVQNDGKCFCLQEKGLEIIKKADFGVQNELFVI